MDYLEWKRTKESDYIVYRSKAVYHQIDYTFNYCFEIVKFEYGYQVSKGESFEDMRVLNSFEPIELLRDAKELCEWDLKHN